MYLPKGGGKRPPPAAAVKVVKGERRWVRKPLYSREVPPRRQYYYLAMTFSNVPTGDLVLDKASVEDWVFNRYGHINPMAAYARNDDISAFGHGLRRIVTIADGYDTEADCPVEIKYPGLYFARQAVEGRPGVYSERTYRRFSSSSEQHRYMQRKRGYYLLVAPTYSGTTRLKKHTVTKVYARDVRALYTWSHERS